MCNLTLKGLCFFFFPSHLKSSKSHLRLSTPQPGSLLPTGRLHQRPTLENLVLRRTSCKGPPLNAVLPHLARSTSVSGKSPCSDWGTLTTLNETARHLNSPMCICWTAEDKSHTKSPMKTTSHGKPRGLCATAEQPTGTASGVGLGGCVWFVMAGSFKGSSLDEALISLKY